MQIVQAMQAMRAVYVEKSVVLYFDSGSLKGQMAGLTRNPSSVTPHHSHNTSQNIVCRITNLQAVAACPPARYKGCNDGAQHEGIQRKAPTILPPTLITNSQLLASTTSNVERRTPRTPCRPTSKSPLIESISSRQLITRNSLTKLAQKLVSEGPHKHEHTPRRVRGLFNGQYIFDSINAHHVWEHPYFPQYNNYPEAFCRIRRTYNIPASTSLQMTSPPLSN